jgi:phosphoglycerate dehydrogenase-like enzyme
VGSIPSPGTISGASFIGLFHVCMHGALKLLIKKTDDDGRLALVPRFVNTAWSIEVVDERDRGQLAAALEEADAMISMDWSRDMPSAPGLRLIQLPGAGTDDIDFDAVPRQAAVCNVYEHEIGIAEYVLAAMLHFTVRLSAMDQALRKAQWWGSALCGPRHGELSGQTLGIIGYGRIGREVARRAHAFGMRVRGCSRSPRDGDPWVERVEAMSALPTLLARSDFVLLSLPLGHSTTGIIGSAQLAQMKPSAVLINVARGPLIEEAALFEACRSKTIAGAAIDTWYRYPRPDAPQGYPSAYPFHELDNVVMTPHASGWTEGLLPRRNRVIAENLDRLAKGLPLQNIVRAASA